MEALRPRCCASRTNQEIEPETMTVGCNRHHISAEPAIDNTEDRGLLSGSAPSQRGVAPHKQRRRGPGMLDADVVEQAIVALSPKGTRCCGGASTRGPRGEGLRRSASTQRFR